MPISLVRRLVKGSPLTAAEHDSNLDNIEGAVDASSSDLSYDAATRVLDSSGGTPVTLPLATTADSGLMAAADKTKIDGVASGATANSADATLLARANHTGTQAGSTITAATTGAAGSMSAADKTKIDGVATGATANSADATLLARANHTGTQAGSTITAATTGAAGSMSAADKTKIDGVATGATANSADATLLARANHTGTQAGSTITGAYNACAMTVSTNNLVLGRLTPGAGGAEELALPAASFTFLATPSSANLRAMLTDEVGTGAAYFVGGALGTPASGTLTSCTGLPSTGISGFAAASRAEAEAFLLAGTNITLTPGGSGATRTYTVAAGSNLVTTTGTQTLTNKTLGLTRESEFTITDAAAFEIDPNNGPLQTIALGANRTPAAPNFANGMSVKLRINAGAFSITWSTVGVVWLSLTPGGSGSAPTLGATGFTHIQLHREASVTYGTLIGYSTT